MSWLGLLHMVFLVALLGAVTWLVHLARVYDRD